MKRLRLKNSKVPKQRKEIILIRSVIFTRCRQVNFISNFQVALIFKGISNILSKR